MRAVDLQNLWDNETMEIYMVISTDALQLDGHEFEWSPGDGDGQGGLVCWDSWGHRVGHDWVTELNWTECLDNDKTMRVMEKAMAPHSSTLAWKIPWTKELGGLQSMGSQRVGHDWATSLSLLTFIHWRRKWPPTPVFLPGESQGWGSLVGCRLWGRTESDTTKATWQQ